MRTDVLIRPLGTATHLEGATPRGRAFLPLLRSATTEFERWDDGWAIPNADLPVALLILQRNMGLKVGGAP